MDEAKEFDLFMVVCERDIKLLRHFFLSYQLFFKTPGKIHLVIWKKDQVLLDQIKCPPNLMTHFKDDVAELTEDDFRNQMYLKLISDRYVTTEWYWVVDADYLLCSPLNAEDFFINKKARWFYQSWVKLPEKTWRLGSELLLGDAIPYQFMETPQYVFNRAVLQRLQQKIDVKQILNTPTIPSEFILYGAFAFRHYPEAYDWINLEENENGSQSISYMVNQRPPTYQVLDRHISLNDIKQTKYCVFWSHWDMAEEKMCQFLLEAQRNELGQVQVAPELQPIHLVVTPTTLSQCKGAAAWDGVYADGWVKQEAAFLFVANESGVIEMKLEAGADNRTCCPNLLLNLNKITRIIDLHPGINFVRIPVFEKQPNLVSLKFNNGVSELNEKMGRVLYVKIRSCDFHGIPGMQTAGSLEHVIIEQELVAQQQESAYLRGLLDQMESCLKEKEQVIQEQAITINSFRRVAQFFPGVKKLLSLYRYFAKATGSDTR